MAMTRDCKSLAFGLRRFESYFQHHCFEIDPSGSFFFCCGQVLTKSLSALKFLTAFSIGIKYLTGKKVMVLPESNNSAPSAFKTCCLRSRLSLSKFSLAYEQT